MAKRTACRITAAPTEARRSPRTWTGTRARELVDVHSPCVSKKRRRPRTERRARERKLDKLGDAREKLARLSAGGAPERAIDVTSASVVEPHALGLGCARCEGELRLLDHEVHETAHGVLRRVRGQCKRCRAVREIWLRIRLLS